MISLDLNLRIYLACGVTRMREGIPGFAMLVQQSLAEDPFRWQFPYLARHIEVPTEIRQPFQSLTRLRNSIRGRETVNGP